MQMINLFLRQLRAALGPRSRTAKAAPPRPKGYVPSDELERAVEDAEAKMQEEVDACNREGTIWIPKKDLRTGPKSCRKITGRHLGQILCDALGESPRNVHRIELIAHARDAAIVKITRFVSDSEARILRANMREFTLVEVEETDKPCT